MKRASEIDEYDTLRTLATDAEEWVEHDRLLRRYVRAVASRRGLDDRSAAQPITTGELSNELHLRRLEHLRRGGRIENARAWLALNADQVIYQAMTRTHDSPENLTARKRLRARRGEQEARLGRELSTNELRELAVEVGGGSGVHHDYWTFSTRISTTLDLTDHLGEPLFDIVDPSSDPAESGPGRVRRPADSVSPDSPAALVLDPDAGKWDINYHAWDALADQVGGPAVAQGELSHRRATQVRTTVQDFGGARRVLAAWTAGALEDADPVVLALRAPFPDASAEQLRRVLDHHGLSAAQADRLWGYAVMTADRSRRASDHQLTA